MLRFVPTTGYIGNATALSANLIEVGTAITSGGTVNISAGGATGGTTHYSASTVALIEIVNDLTQLKKSHGGTYSTKDFEEKINGMGMSPAHGTTEMPVWGPIFREIAGSPVLRVFNLKKFIDGMQTP